MQAPAERIAELTIDCMLRHVPAGIVFLSGWPIGGRGNGQPERDQPARRTLGLVVLIRTGPATVSAQGLGGRSAPTTRRPVRAPSHAAATAESGSKSWSKRGRIEPDGPTGGGQRGV